MVQPPMHWALEDNLAEILASLKRAAEAGSQLCVLPELALTGFHRRMPEALDAARLAAAERRLREECARLGVALSYGLPTLEGPGRVFNSYVLIDAGGLELGRTYKQGLTPSEASLFALGSARAWAPLGDWQIAVVLCREVLDDIDLPQVPGPRLLLWPSYIAQHDMPGYLSGAAALARRHNAWVAQCNWPVSLNEPEGAVMAGSTLIAPDGAMQAQLPAGTPDHACWPLPVGPWVRQSGAGLS